MNQVVRNRPLCGCPHQNLGGRKIGIAIDTVCDALSKSGDWARALRLADECEESAQVWAHKIDTRQRAAAELRRLHVQSAQDEALLRQALEALDSDHPDIQLRTAIAVRQRLGEQSLRTDAERYRWLRDKADSITVCTCTDDGEWVPLHPNNIDSTIDAAMEADRD